MERTDLDRVRISAEAARTGQAMLEAQIRQARSSGHSYREIAKEAGLSHEQVRRIASR
jgi:hypothetical protein